jgi:hypothetical protein
MKLTLKDKDFIEKLKSLMESKELSIELKEDGLKRLVLHRNHGDKIETEFNMTRQGVRWRFHRLFNEIYISAYETVYWIESLFGTYLRQQAMEIVKERVDLRKKAKKMDDFEFCRREKGSKDFKSEDAQL